MSAHLQVLKTIFETLDKDLQRAMLWTFNSLLKPHYVKQPNEIDETDDVLIALRKREARKDALISSMRNDGIQTWQDFEILFYQHVERGVSDSFLVTGLLDVIDSDLKFLNNAPLPEFLERNAKMIEWIRGKLEEEPVENHEKWEEMLAVMEQAREDAPTSHKANRDRYMHWRAVAGDRLDMPRIHGAWEDCIIEDSKGSTWHEDWL